MRGIQGNNGTTSAGDNLSGDISPSTERRIFLCRMNVSRNARRQMRFGDQKVNSFWVKDKKYDRTPYISKLSNLFGFILSGRFSGRPFLWCFAFML